MSADDAGFWTALAANQEFWRQIPYWITAIAAIAGSLLGAWVGAKLNHSTAINREREARRRSNLERIAELANAILSRAIDFHAACRITFRELRNPASSLKDASHNNHYVESLRELESATRRSIEAFSLISVIGEQQLQPQFERLLSAANHLHSCLEEPRSATEAEIEERLSQLNKIHDDLIDSIRKAWWENRA